MTVEAAPAGAFAIGCASCGAVQAAPRSAPHGVLLSCRVCEAQLERTTGRSLDAALASAGATFLLLIPANLFPLMTTAAMGSTRTSHLASTAAAMWRDNRPWVGVFVSLFLIVTPLVRFGVLSVVLAEVRSGRIAHHTGHAFRLDQELETWAMSDVFLLALMVAYARLAASISVRLDVGAYCFIGAGVMSLVTRAFLDRRAVWEAISPSPAVAPTGPAVICNACGLVHPEAMNGHHCPRCGNTIHSRRPGAVRRAAALTLAAMLLYIPANLFPIATLPIGFSSAHYTVLEGVKDLFQARLFGLAIIIFCASFLIPMLKLVAMGWFIASVVRRSRRHLVLKTRLYRAIEEIGRWSMIDPFVIGAFVPVMHYNNFVYARAEPAAAAFSFVVVGTMLAARCFDPRLMWDAAEVRHDV
ncbi:MAG TPA: paraquat-inducible protein A [Caulobacteraceae bacterium]